ncbi:MAG TPA: tRNA lysidine(34) synthetase TilS [Casimicrobiaceae bacterium]|nr:tRNA lysidine(34) synthetase TilS [Casimicrobiaceae bacterium]
MGSSRNSRPAEPPEPIASVTAALAASLAAHANPGARIAVALSGGIDSMALLDAACELAPGHRIELSAIHVHHGISPHADTWAAFCAEQCAARGVALAIHRLAIGNARGASLEARARKLRYERLRGANADLVALAHHADDQAETLLLQLMRGAGPHGLAAMPAFTPGPPPLLRPLLGLTRASLAAYARARHLSWIDDESNAEPRYARNFLRHEVVPRLRQRFPGYPATLLRAARHQAQAAALLDELAGLDAAGAVAPEGLARERLAELSAARAGNLLRWYLRREGLRAPSEARLNEMLRQLLEAGNDARIRIAQDGAELGRHRGLIAVHAPAGAAFARVWSGEREVALPGGVLAFEPTRGAGVAAAKVSGTSVTLRSRGGGERIRLAADRPRRAVKKLLQEAHMPAWERQALPLVWSEDELVAVPGIGVALDYQAAPGESGWRIEWRPGRRG